MKNNQKITNWLLPKTPKKKKKEKKENNEEDYKDEDSMNIDKESLIKIILLLKRISIAF